MTFLQSASTPLTMMEVDSYAKTGRLSLWPAGKPVSVSGSTGTMAAALGANSLVFAARVSELATGHVLVTRVRIQWTCLLAFTTAVTAGRRIAVRRAAVPAALAASGTVLTAVLHNSSDPAVITSDVRIATTAGLTATGVTVEASDLAQIPLAGFGSIGSFQDMVVDLSANPIRLGPGEALVLTNPVAMDVVGTWQLAVHLNLLEF